MESIFKKSSRFESTCIVALFLALFFNVCLFFLYEAKYCSSSIQPTQFSLERHVLLHYYQIFKEIATRVVPIVVLIISNVFLMLRVKKSRDKVRKKSLNAQALSARNSKKPMQETQLTKMTIFVAILYIATTVPMMFAYPGLVFKDMSTPAYKTYAAWSNILELIQCSSRIVIYICFTSNFRDALINMFKITTYSNLKLASKKEFQQISKKNIDEIDL